MRKFLKLNGVLPLSSFKPYSVVAHDEEGCDVFTIWLSPAAQLGKHLHLPAEITFESSPGHLVAQAASSNRTGSYKAHIATVWVEPYSLFSRCSPVAFVGRRRRSQKWPPRVQWQKTHAVPLTWGWPSCRGRPQVLNQNCRCSRLADTRRCTRLQPRRMPCASRASVASTCMLCTHAPANSLVPLKQPPPGYGPGGMYTFLQLLVRPNRLNLRELHVALGKLPAADSTGDPKEAPAPDPRAPATSKPLLGALA